MARILLASFGSLGDLHPYIAIGVELQRRGHAATLATSEAHRDRVEAESLSFHPVRPNVDLNDRELLSYVMDARRGSERVVRYLAEAARESYEDTLDAAREADLIVTHPVTFGAVVAAQKLAISWISTVLAPLSLISAYDPPVSPNAPLTHPLLALWPPLAKWVWQLARKQTLSWVSPVQALRRELGMAPAEHPLFEGSHSPAAVLALFSRCLAAPQPDWPPNTVVTGFPFYDHGEMDEELLRFLRAGPPPVLFTLGSSAVGAAGSFYVDSLAAVTRLGCRAVFLTGTHPQGLPPKLPEGVVTLPYASHGAIFPRSAAIVHQGGIGTTAQAMRSGRPQLVVPFAHDQFDNAARVRRLGAAQVVHRSAYTAGRAARVLGTLLQRRSYEQAAAAIGELVRRERGAECAADEIERRLRS